MIAKEIVAKQQADATEAVDVFLRLVAKSLAERRDIAQDMIEARQGGDEVDLRHLIAVEADLTALLHRIAQLQQNRESGFDAPAFDADPDLTPEQVAVILKTDPQNVRRWCRGKRFTGAYQVTSRHGGIRKWRIPQSALGGFVPPPPAGRPRKPD